MGHTLRKQTVSVKICFSRFHQSFMAVMWLWTNLHWPSSFTKTFVVHSCARNGLPLYVPLFVTQPVTTAASPYSRTETISPSKVSWIKSPDATTARKSSLFVMPVADTKRYRARARQYAAWRTTARNRRSRVVTVRHGDVPPLHTVFPRVTAHESDSPKARIRRLRSRECRPRYVSR
jgi:hypothetical protein